MVATALLLRLLLAHIIADFFLQPLSWVKSKRKQRIKSLALVFHALTHGILAYLLLADWGSIWLPMAVVLVHWSIDLFKTYQKPTFMWFVVDQLLHIISLVVLWALFYGDISSVWDAVLAVFQNKKSLGLLIGYLLILNPTAILIDVATQKWQKELYKKKDKTQTLSVGLTHAGKWIGILERILILTFILLGQYAAIGFLITAKSIFRFGDLTKNKERKLTEYIVIGTFLSFSITLIIGLIIKYLLGWH